MNARIFAVAACLLFTTMGLTFIPTTAGMGLLEPAPSLATPGGREPVLGTYTQKIVGGTPSIDGEHPYAARLLIDVGSGSALCGGTWIAEDWILTAAHCVDSGVFGVSVQLGSNVAGDPSAIYREADQPPIVHPDWDPGTMDSDLALIHMEPLPASLAKYTPALAMVNGLTGPATELEDLTVPSLTVLGWGTTSSGGPISSVLRDVAVPFVPRATCNEPARYGGDITVNMFCAGNTAVGGVDSCQGDSGGPIGTPVSLPTTTGPATAPFVQYGIVSWGIGCAQANFPGVYTDVKNFVSWISDVLANGGNESGSGDATCDLPDVDVGFPAGIATPGATPSTGLHNNGFETGTFPAWGEGTVVDDVQVIGGDAWLSPFEGEFMGRLGDPPLSPPGFGEQQPGPNVICQAFTPIGPKVRFVYNFFTQDYSMYDHLTFQVKVAATGVVLHHYWQEAFGPAGDISLKTTGWRLVDLDVSGYEGQVLIIQFSAGGTVDSLYNSWVYIDSADQNTPQEAIPPEDIEASAQTGTVNKDPSTGQLQVLMPGANLSPLTITLTVVCPDGTAPAGVLLLLDKTFPDVTLELPMTPMGSNVWTVTIPAVDLNHAVLVPIPLYVQADCNGAAVNQSIGILTLIDPAGIIYDAFSGLPIEGAQVTLFTLPGTVSGTDCPAGYTPPAPGPTAQQLLDAVMANPLETILYDIDPNINPMTVGADGLYSWDVTAACWFVLAQAVGYSPAYSAVVGIPPEVTTLDVFLTPLLTPKLVGTSLQVPYQLTLDGAPWAGITAGTFTVHDDLFADPILKTGTWKSDKNGRGTVNIPTTGLLLPDGDGLLHFAITGSGPNHVAPGFFDVPFTIGPVDTELMFVEGYLLGGKSHLCVQLLRASGAPVVGEQVELKAFVPGVSTPAVTNKFKTDAEGIGCFHGVLKPDRSMPLDGVNDPWDLQFRFPGNAKTQLGAADPVNVVGFVFPAMQPTVQLLGIHWAAGLPVGTFSVTDVVSGQPIPSGTLTWLTQPDGGGTPYGAGTGAISKGLSTVKMTGTPAGFVDYEAVVQVGAVASQFTPAAGPFEFPFVGNPFNPVTEVHDITLTSGGFVTMLEPVHPLFQNHLPGIKTEVLVGAAGSDPCADPLDILKKAVVTSPARGASKATITGLAPGADVGIFINVLPSIPNNVIGTCWELGTIDRSVAPTVETFISHNGGATFLRVEFTQGPQTPNCLLPGDHVDFEPCTVIHNMLMGDRVGPVKFDISIDGPDGFTHFSGPNTAPASGIFTRNLGLGLPSGDFTGDIFTPGNPAVGVDFGSTPIPFAVSDNQLGTAFRTVP